jgi:hypothetical protein
MLSHCPKRFSNCLIKPICNFQFPPDFTSTPIIQNGDVVYDFAIKSKTSSLEIRYRIWPVDKKQKNPNALFEPMLITMGLNISNGKVMKPHPYPTESVKKEFGADAGSTGLTITDSNFGKGYKQCMISVIHKDDVADAYVFYLYNTQDEIMGAVTTEKVYHALKFK